MKSVLEDSARRYRPCTNTSKLLNGRGAQVTTHFVLHRNVLFQLQLIALDFSGGRQCRAVQALH